MSSSTADTRIRAELRVPRETVNDDVVTIQQWHVAHGEAVRAGQLVVGIETSKAVLEVEAEAEGFVEILKPRGSEVPIGSLIGRVLAEAPAAQATTMAPATNEPRAQASGSPPPSASSPARTNGAPRSSNRLRDKLDASRTNGSHGPVSGAPGSSAAHRYPERVASSVAISRKAQALIAEHGIDPAAAFPGYGLIREADVRKHLDAHSPSPREGTGGRAARGPEQRHAPIAQIASPEILPPTPSLGEGASKPYAPKKGGLLGDAAVSATERGNKSVLWLGWNYFWRNWLLGNLARWAPRGVILPIHRMRGVRMGKDVFIDPTAIIETAYPENITIGNDVRVTAGCVIMTHIKAPHHLRESGLVPSVLKPVVLEDHCFIGVNSVIMPGVTVGEGAVVTSGSVVVTNVPPYTMAQGNPAKVIRQFQRPTSA